MTVLLVILAVVVIAVIWVISTKNNFQRLEIKVQEGLSGIEVALTKRYDLLTKQVDACKGYMEHEEATFEKVIALRQGMSVEELNQAERDMNNIASTISVVAENYPELRSSEVFVELQKGIADAEEHLQASRRLYNANVSAYNTSIAMFPAKLLADGRTPLDFFAADEEKKQDVKIDF